MTVKKTKVKTVKKKSSASKTKKAAVTTKSKKPVRAKAAIKAGNEKAENNIFPVVGIGASAGGLEALEVFFDNVPADSNLAYVVVQHLSPSYKSIMDSLLQKHTGMPVKVIEDGMSIMPNCIYLNPPEKNVGIIKNTLVLMEPSESHGMRLPIDFFFRSLARDHAEKAVCIVLSGTGSDGTLGLKEIKGEGGITFAQDESQAKYDSMPRNAIDTGMVDYILPVEKMPAELLRYMSRPFTKGIPKGFSEQQYATIIKKIFFLIRTVTGHDFSNYKPATISRRLDRRMGLHQIQNIGLYLRYLQEDPKEVEALFKDILIGVTNFFRDTDAFELLEKKIIPEILKNKSPDSEVRVWVPGCATGEEAYSIAMLFLEAMDEMNKFVYVQIFATDIDTDALEYGRSGVYPESIAANVSPARLKKFFIKDESTYKIKKLVRETVIFAVQNLIKDPPFSKLDLVSCRNLLIYLDTKLQKKLMPLFHYTLNSDGYLFLGSSESIGEFADLFSPVNTKWKIYRRKGIDLERREYPAIPYVDAGHETPAVQPTETVSGDNVRHMAERLVLQEYAPAYVLINEKFDVIYFHGRTEMFLIPPSGEPTFNIMKLARPDLRHKLSSAIHEVSSKKITITCEGLQVKHNGVVYTFDLIVRPMSGQAPMTMLVLFEIKLPAVEMLVSEKTGKGRKRGAKEDPRTVSLEHELRSTKEYLQTTIEELETSNEELKSTNEELQSTNEELQSTNEELETSKEELQSTNEELGTVNSEYQNKIEELSRSNDDLNNLLSSTKIGTIFLDMDLKIKRFTPQLTEIFNLIKSDVGRPIGDITSKILYDNILKEAESVLNTLARKEIEISTKDKKFYNMRILPYRTVENMIDGVVITFIDITELKKTKNELIDALVYAESIVENIREPLIVLDKDLRVITANNSFYQKFRVTKKETEKHQIFQLGNGQWNIPALKELLEKILEKKPRFDDFLVKHSFPGIGAREMRLNARKIKLKGKGTEMILLAMEDMTK